MSAWPAMLVAASAILLQEPAGEPTLRAAWPPIRTIDPAMAIAESDRLVTDALFAGCGDAEAKVEGAVLTFRLPDAKWSDGRPVTASDFRFAWIRCLTPSTGSPWAHRFRRIRGATAFYESQRLADLLVAYDSESSDGRRQIAALAKSAATKKHVPLLRDARGQEPEEALRRALDEAITAAAGRDDVEERDVAIEAVDARTLRVTLDGPWPGFVEMAATTPFRVVPPDAVRTHRDEWAHPRNLVTCGAYRLDRWTSDEMALARVPAAGAAGPDRVSIRMIGRIDEAWPLYARGTVDWLDGALVPPEKLQELAESGELRTAPSEGILCVRPNADRGPFAKPPLRVAIAQAVDRDRLVKLAARGAAAAWSVTDRPDRSAPARDVAAALTALIADTPDLARFPRLNLLCWKGPRVGAIAAELRGQWEGDLAIRIRIDAREGPAYRRALDAGDFDLALVEAAPEPGDAESVLDILCPGGRARGEPSVLAEALVIPLLRDGRYLAAKPHVELLPGWPLRRVRLKK